MRDASQSYKTTVHQIQTIICVDVLTLYPRSIFLTPSYIEIK